MRVSKLVEILMTLPAGAEVMVSVPNTTECVDILDVDKDPSCPVLTTGPVEFEDGDEG